MKKNLSFVVLMLLATGAWAQQLSEEQACERALQYLNHNSAAKTRGMATVGKKITATKIEPKCIYAFNIEGGGYVIASGDSRALPVLGYSDKGSIDWDQLPENMKGWLKSYDEAMATLGNCQDFKDGIALGKPAKTRAAKAAIEPLIKTTWHSMYAPYCIKTPLYEGAVEELQGQQCQAGPVAAVMAQVMNYYQWPKTSPEIPAYDAVSYSGDEEKTWHIDGLPAVTFDWDNMIDAYAEYEGGGTEPIRILGTEAQQEAVATLMRYCGQAASTNYSPNGSSSLSNFMSEALVKYFGYDDGAQIVGRTQYGIDEWEDLIYGELEGGHPVMYSAISELTYYEIARHMFICDGYDGNGLFHINWCWGGNDNGYFSLSVLDPSDLMSRRNCFGFHRSQEAAINVRPAPEGYQYQQIHHALYLCPGDPLNVVAPDLAYFSFFYEAAFPEKEIFVDTAFGTCSDDGTLTPLFIGDPSDSLMVNCLGNDLGNFFYVKIDSTAFQPGEQLTLYPMIRFRDQPGAEWQMLGSKDYCIYAGRTDNDKFFLYSCVDLYDLEIVKAEFRKGGGEPGVRSELVLTIRNNGETDFVSPVFLSPLYFGNVKPDEITADTPYTVGDFRVSQGYLRPGEEAEMPFSIMTWETGTIYLQFWLEDGTVLGGTFVEATATGINRRLQLLPTDQYFDLQGRRLEGRPVKRGIYIHNNRKELIP